MPDRKHLLSGTKIAIHTRVIALYPGESFTLTLTVERNRRPERLELKGPPDIIRIRAKPRTGYTPLNTHLTIETEPGAPAGWYLLEILAVGNDRSLLSREKPLVLILDRVIGKRVLKHLPEMLRITKRLGVQGLFWYILERVYPEGARFKQLHELYKLIVGRDVSKGTTGNMLKYMIKKKIIYNKNEVYKFLVHDLKTLESRIDASIIWLHQRRDNTRGKLGEPNIVPQQVYWTFDRAQRIKNKHGTLAAMYFLIYSLMGVRQTGLLLLWVNDWFLNYENKTGFCHYFASSLLSFKLLGLREGKNAL